MRLRLNCCGNELRHSVPNTPTVTSSVRALGTLLAVRAPCSPLPEEEGNIGSVALTLDAVHPSGFIGLAFFPDAPPPISDYYLNERLREFAELREDPKPAYMALCELYLGAAADYAGKSISDLKKGLIEPALAALGFDAPDAKPTASHDTVLTQALNSAQSNSAWPEKKRELLWHSLLPINQQLHDKDKWDEAAIADRSEALFKRTVKLWPRQ